MFISLTILSIIFLGTTCYDHNVFKDCSRVQLCSENRELPRQNRLSGTIPGSIFAQGVATIPLTNQATNQEITLVITAIENSIFKLELIEPNVERYHIENILVQEPQVVNFEDVQLTLSTIELAVGTSKVLINASPFSVEFYNGNVLQMVLEGDRITLQSNNQSTPFTFGVTFPSSRSLYGLHQHSDNLALGTTEPGGTDPYRLRVLNLENYEQNDTQGMFGVIPLLYGVGPSGTTGLFLLNAAEAWVEVNNSDSLPSAFYMVDSGAFTLYILPGTTPAESIKKYTGLTGVPHMPLFWALGYHQLGANAFNEKDVENVVLEMDSNGFPIETVWLGSQCTINGKFFTWNQNFSTIAQMLANLADNDRYLITLSDPFFKKEEGYKIYNQLVSGEYYVKNPDGTIFEADSAVGTAIWVDFLNPDARAYYSSLFSYDNWPGTTPALGGIWHNKNEATVLDAAAENTFQYDLLHYGEVPNRNIHNVYNLLQVMASHEGMLQRDRSSRRPFILTRAHTAGTQRYAAITLGESTADWASIPLSYAMCLTAAISGISFCGADIGGSYGNPSEELLLRYHQASAWLPFFRGVRKPYQYLAVDLRTAIMNRYTYLPLWYTLFYEHTRFGEPVIRPLWYHYPDEIETYEIQDQILVGSDVLIKAVSQENASSVQMYFPGGANVLWFDESMDGTFYEGSGWAEVPVTLDKIPVFFKQGSIIPTFLWDMAAASHSNNMMLKIPLFDNFTASGTYYIDDRRSFQYKDYDKYTYIRRFANYKESFLTNSTPIDNTDGTAADDFPVVIEMYLVPDENLQKKTGRKKYMRRLSSTDEELLKKYQ